MASDVSMDYLQSQLPCLLLQTSLLSAWACLAQAHSGLSWSLWEPCWACSANTSTQHGGHLSCSHCLRRSFFFYKTMDTVFPQLDTEATTALLQARWISPSSVRVPDEGGSVHVPALGQVTVSSCVPSSVAACFCLCKQLSKTTVNVFPSLFQHEFFQNRLSNNGQKKKKKKINKGKKQPFFAAVLKFTQQFFKLWRWLQSGLWPLLLNSIVWKHAVLNLSEISYPGYYNKYKGFLYYR